MEPPDLGETLTVKNTCSEGHSCPDKDLVLTCARWALGCHECYLPWLATVTGWTACEYRLTAYFSDDLD